MNIQPLGEQIIIKTVPVDSIGSIVLPDSAKGITQKGSGGDMDAVHFVEAEVIAVGPGKRQKGDARLIEDLWDRIRAFVMNAQTNDEELKALKGRIDNQGVRIPPLVKPGDRILYHPAVQRFDREITDVMVNGDGEVGARYFMIREDSVLAVIDREDA